MLQIGYPYWYSCLDFQRCKIILFLCVCVCRESSWSEGTVESLMNLWILWWALMGNFLSFILSLYLIVLVGAIDIWHLFSSSSVGYVHGLKMSKTPKYINTRVDEVFPVKKSSDMFRLISTKEKAKVRVFPSKSNVFKIWFVLWVFFV